MSSFPTNARTGQTHKKFGRKYAYSEITSSWTPLVPLASVAEVRKTEATAASATQFYALATDLPLSGNTAGSMAFVQETNRLYLWSGTGWYNVATISGAASSITGANSSYTLATDGTPIVVTLSQTGLTSPTWSYQVTTGSLGRTATVTQADNVFTITPSTRAKDIGSFGITFKATDGSNTLVTTSQFSMSNTAPVISSGPSATYTLASDGTPTVITLAATDADGHDITWSYEVVSGSLGGTTVSINGSEFTITPSTNSADAGTFQLRFIASDGASFDADISEFSLSFGPDWTSYTVAFTLDNPNPSTVQAGEDQFGNAVATTETHCIVGAWYEDNTSPQRGNDGKAYIYNVTTGQLLYTLDNPNTTPNNGGDQFGIEVAIDGNYAAVCGDCQGPGEVYIYNVTNGNLVRTIVNPLTSNSFGRGLKIVGDYLFIGAPGAVTGRGRVYIYSISTGTLIKTLAPTVDVQQAFGNDIDVYGNYIIIGAYYYGTWSGSALLFKTDTGDWTDTYHVWTKTNPNVATNDASDYFGAGVAINDSYVVVAAREENDPNDTARNAGRVYIYNLAGTLQRELSNPITSGYAKFGYGLSLDGNNLLVVDPYCTVNGNAQQGQGYIYNVTDGTLLSTVVNPNAYGSAAGDYFGGFSGHGFNSTCSIKGQYAIIGAGQEDTDGTYYNAGKAYIFQAG